MYKHLGSSPSSWYEGINPTCRCTRDSSVSQGWIRPWAGIYPTWWRMGTDSGALFKILLLRSLVIFDDNLLTNKDIAEIGDKHWLRRNIKIFRTNLIRLGLNYHGQIIYLFTCSSSSLLTITSGLLLRSVRGCEEPRKFQAQEYQK